MGSDDLIIILTAGLLATACGLLGTFLVLRRQALLSDAVSHAVLPGIVLVFLLTGGRTGWVMLAGATAFGVLCVLGVEWLRNTRLVTSDAAIALMFPALFSLGVVGISTFASGSHLDLDATIYGEITFAPLRTTEILGVTVPKSLLVTGVSALAALAFLRVFWRPLTASTFDPEFATVVGLRGRLVGHVLLAAVAAVAVAAFESVGAILVVTFFIVPAATAHLLARRLEGMLIAVVAVGWICAVVGQQTAVHYDTSIPGTMGLVAGGCFLLALLLAPRRGLLWRLRRSPSATA